jgi:predicted NAD/FAD-binding protein
MNRLAIVGSGIAGLGLAYYLRDQFEITVYEKNDRPGGHSYTVEVPENGVNIPIDTGFMVFNQTTYPNLVGLFNELNVPIMKTDMSFSVQNLLAHLEFSGASFDRLFGNRKNLFSLEFWKLLLQIDRFNKEAKEGLSNQIYERMSLRDYVRARNYGDQFLNDYLVPMSSALWSTYPSRVLNFPARTLLRFFQNHGLLGQNTQLQWWTVKGGAQEYLKRLLAALPGLPVLSNAVTRVQRKEHNVTVNTKNGESQVYDKVALACHADEALDLLTEPLEKERRLLGAFAYQRNETLLHTDCAVMPEQKRCWASWNYRLDKQGASTHYWMNSLQNVSKRKNYFVTLNGEHLVDASAVLKRITYHHPLFDKKAIEAQEQLSELNSSPENNQIFFCGSYFGYGFHEDALTSSLQLAQELKRKGS